ncbi:MAG: DUF2726 domain-containing protein [Anaerolineales bacterium]
MIEKNQRRKSGLRKLFGLGNALDARIITAAPDGEKSQARNTVKEDFLSEAEISFYRVLVNMFSERLVVFPKVSLPDVVSLIGSASDEQFTSINHTAIDFLLCDLDSLKPVLAVTLDNASDPGIEQGRKTELLNDLLTGCGLPFVRVKSQESYKPSDLARTFREAIENTMGTTIDTED